MSESSTKTSKVILGIDPGTVVMGYAVIEVSGQSIRLIAMGSIKLVKLDEQAKRLRHIFDRMTGIIDEYLPDELAIEAQFFGKNVQSMLKLGRAQGVCIAAALNRDMPYVEYAPRRIKQAVTGNGNAAKEQVAGMLKSILKLDEIPSDMDASDGLAVAICHHYSSRLQGGGKKYSGWSSFVNQNPSRSRS